MFFGSTATSLTPRRSAALRFACKKSSMPCSAMMRAASWANARRKSSARCEYFLGMSLKERLVAVGHRVCIIGAFIGFRFRQIAFDEFLHDPIRIVGTCEQPRVGRNSHRHDAVGHGGHPPRRAR